MASYGCEAWKLNDDPFRLLGSALIPLQNEKHLSYFCDLYHWKDETKLSSIGDDGRIKVFQLNSGSTATVVISGPAGCGRSSLENLLLYEVTKRSAAEPLIMRLKLNVRQPDAASRGLAIAQATMRKAGQLDANAGTVVTQTFTLWKDTVVGSLQPDIGLLLGQLKEDLAAHFPDAKVVVCLDALDHMITFSAALEAVDLVQDFADMVILSVTLPDDAKFIRGQINQRQRLVAWVNAPRVEADKFRLCIERRLAAERIVADIPHSLYPFTDTAVRRVFSAANENETVELPIRIAIQKLSGAMQKKVAALAQANGVDPEIGDDDVRSVLVNEGS